MTTCYRQVDGGDITPFSGVTACTSSSDNSTYTSCCFDGDTCLEDSLCYASSAASGSTGYFEALCTDPTFQNPSCSHRCTAYTKGDVVYDTNNDIWSCCGTDSDGNPNCNNPTTVTFTAPNPQALLAQASDASSSLSSSSSSASATSATSRATSTRASQGISSTTSSNTGATPTTSSTSSNAASTSGLSSGAKAGIGIGAAIGVVVIIGLLVWIAMLYRRQKRNPQSHDPMSKQYLQQQHGDAPPYDRPPPPFTPGMYGSPAPVAEMGETDKKSYHRVPNQNVYEMAS